MPSTDQIERSVLINAPLDKVWHAISSAEEFGTWFGVNLKGQNFEVGQSACGLITGCGHENVWFDVVIESIEAPKLLSYRWHPCPIDPAVDYSKESPILVTFTLKDVASGTLLKVVESGYDNVPSRRRLEAFLMNSNGCGMHSYKIL